MGGGMVGGVGMIEHTRSTAWMRSPNAVATNRAEDKASPAAVMSCFLSLSATRLHACSSRRFIMQRMCNNVHQKAQRCVTPDCSNGDSCEDVCKQVENEHGWPKCCQL